MALTDYVIMPSADYLDACNAIREKDGSTALIKSGEMGSKIRAISGGAALNPNYALSLEYLKCTGTQYIDTRICAKTNSGFDLRGEFNFQSSATRFGARNTPTSSANTGAFMLIAASSSQFRVSYGSGSEDNTNILFEPKKKANRIVMDGMSQTITIYFVDGTFLSETIQSEAFTVDCSSLLFAFNNAGTPMLATDMKVSSYKYYEDGKLIQDLAPVLDFGYVPCMYDNVSGQFHYNQGADAFEYKIAALPELNLPSIGRSLNEYTWQEISIISASGKAPEYFSIGDRKAVLINGKVGTKNINETYYVYIIGFNHDGNIGTIDFGTFKSDISNGKDIALKDSNSQQTNGTKAFNFNHWGNLNYGGWAGCDLRYDILGSTDVAPSGYGSAVTPDRVGYDATVTCATDPVPNTLMAALPYDLRVVMKPMVIYTDNKAGASNDADCISATIDYLPLAAEYEIFGVQKMAHAGEQMYQTQYEYYAAGNSTKKYSDLNTSTGVVWYLRNSSHTINYGAGCVLADGTCGGSSIHASHAIAPIFRV